MARFIKPLPFYFFPPPKDDNKKLLCGIGGGGIIWAGGITGEAIRTPFERAFQRLPFGNDLQMAEHAGQSCWCGGWPRGWGGPGHGVELAVVDVEARRVREVLGGGLLADDVGGAEDDAPATPVLATPRPQSQKKKRQSLLESQSVTSHPTPQSPPTPKTKPGGHSGHSGQNI